MENVTSSEHRAIVFKMNRKEAAAVARYLKEHSGSPETIFAVDVDTMELIVQAKNAAENDILLLEGEEDTVYGIRRGSPLIAAVDDSGCYIASDVPAIIEYTRRYYLLEEEEIVRACHGELSFFHTDGTPLQKEPKTANWSVEQAQKGGYPCFMQKEIHEQPRALADTIEGRTRDGFVSFAEDGLPDGFFRDVTKL